VTFPLIFPSGDISLDIPLWSAERSSKTNVFNFFNFFNSFNSQKLP